MTKSGEEHKTVKETPATYTSTLHPEPVLSGGIPTGRTTTAPAIGIDVQTFRELIAELEHVLAAMKRIVAQFQPFVATEADTQQSCFSLYGVFPATHTTWQDFQDAKRAWRKEVEDIP